MAARYTQCSILRYSLQLHTIPVLSNRSLKFYTSKAISRSKFQIERVMSKENGNKFESCEESDYFGVSDLHLHKKTESLLDREQTKRSEALDRILAGIHEVESMKIAEKQSDTKVVVDDVAGMGENEAGWVGGTEEVNSSLSPEIQSVVHSTAFGTIRFDRENVKTVREMDEIQMAEVSEIHEQGEIDEKEVSNWKGRHSHQQKENFQVSGSFENVKEVGLEEKMPEESVNFIEDQYFGSTPMKDDKTGFSEKANSEMLSIADPQSHLHLKEKQSNSQDLNFIDQQYFDSANECSDVRVPKQKSKSSEVPTIPEDLNFIDAQYFGDVGQNFEEVSEDIDVDTTSKALDFHPSEAEKHLEKCEVVEKDEDVHDETLVVRKMTVRELKQRNRKLANVEKPETAYDMAIKLRLEMRHKHKPSQGKYKDAASSSSTTSGLADNVDSFGYKLLTNQTQNLTELSGSTVVKILADSVIYDDNDIVAIDKPYGLACMTGWGQDHDHHAIEKYLPEMAKFLCKKHVGEPHFDLHMVHRLDKSTTGIMLLAKSKNTAVRLCEMFARHNVLKRYWALTRGVPDPSSGIINIPMAEGSIDGRHRMVLKPVRTEENKMVVRKSGVKSKQATTEYEVLTKGANDSCALLQVQPKTGVKHQIRCHLGFGVGCPILGDHKYSHLSKLAPQKLPGEMLLALGVRQAKVRTVPMHLHCRSVVLPSFLSDGRNLLIQARLPQHFVSNCKSLKISLQAH